METYAGWTPPCDKDAFPEEPSSSSEAPQNEIRMVLLGKTGTGKSRTGSSILGIPRTFSWNLQPKATTTTCAWKTASRFGRKIDIVDTPGVFETERSNADIQNEIKKCIGLTTPGPHAILLCVQMGKFTVEDISTLKHFIKYFGEKLVKYVILVFTRADDWEREQDDLDEKIDINSYILGLQASPRNFLKKCNDRYVLWNNRLKDSKMNSQVEMLLQMIDDMIEVNQGSYYTNEDYKKVERALQLYIEESVQSGDREMVPLNSFASPNCRSPDFDRSYDSTLENSLGGPWTIRDQVKNSTTFVERIRQHLRSLNINCFSTVEDDYLPIP